MQTNWQYLYSHPTSQGKLKTNPEDFQVIEELGYEPTGEGEHIYLWLEKTNLNTAFLAEELAKFCQLPLRAITYAGRKDKHANTFQWFGVHLPGKGNFDWSIFQCEGAKIHQAVRHNKKLRVGNLKGNRFNLVIRDLTIGTELNERLQQIAKEGVPNYFGQQRFGESSIYGNNGNLLMAEKMLAGEAIRNRNKRSMAISALRSYVFNHFVSARIQQGLFDTPLLGDAMELGGSHSFFIQDNDLASSKNRMEEGDINISAPMWGTGDLPTKEHALTFEQSIEQGFSAETKLLSTLGLKHERRAIRLLPKDMQWSIDGSTLNLAFSLPSGAFATSVVREIVDTEHTEQTNHS